MKDLLYESKKKEKWRNEDIDEKEFVDNEDENIEEDESEIKKRIEIEKKRWWALKMIEKIYNIVKWIQDKSQYR